MLLNSFSKFFLFFCIVFSFSGFSQESTKNESYETINVDTLTFTPIQKLPVHTGFDLLIPFQKADSVKKIFLWKSKTGEYQKKNKFKPDYFYNLDSLTFKPQFLKKQDSSSKEEYYLRVKIPNLEPNYVYDIIICKATTKKVITDTKNFVKFKNENQPIIIDTSALHSEKYKICNPKISEKSDIIYEIYSFINVSNKLAWATEGKDKYAFDVGYLATPLSNNFIMPAFGLQYYFKYYDDEERMKLAKSRGKIFHRFGPYIGFTFNSIAKTGDRSDLFKNRSALFGVNFRLSNSIRLGAGSMVFYKESNNLILDDKKLTSTYYAGINLNLKLLNILTDASQLFKFISRP